MELMDWDGSLTIDLPEVDADHIKLAELMNTLITHINAGEPLAVIGKVLNDLMGYTSWHFRHEERLMQSHRYPDFASHRQEHQELIRHAIGLQQRFAAEGTDVTQELVTLLKGWLANHILVTDRAMADYLRPRLV